MSALDFTKHTNEHTVWGVHTRVQTHTHTAVASLFPEREEWQSAHQCPQGLRGLVGILPRVTVSFVPSHQAHPLTQDAQTPGLLDKRNPVLCPPPGTLSGHRGQQLGLQGLK